MISLSEHHIRGLLSSQESKNIEFKETLHDLKVNNEKAEFVRNVLALANCTEPSVSSYLLFGVQDKRRGGNVVGIATPVNGEQIAQILSEYTSPVPNIHVTNTDMDGKTIGLVIITWTELFPYFAMRSPGPSLTPGVGYTRRDSVIGIMSHVELEHHLRVKSGRLGPLLIKEPLQCGFIEGGNWSGPYGPTLRITNVSDVEIKDVEVVFDVHWSPDPRVFQRIPVRNGPLNIGQSIEQELDLRNIYLKVDGERLSPGSSPIARWIDVLARVRYRDTYGLLQEIRATTFVNG